MYVASSSDNWMVFGDAELDSCGECDNNPDNNNLTLNSILLNKITNEVSISSFINDGKNKSYDNVLNKFQNKINTLKNLNIQKSINWCNKYQLTINKYFILS